MKLLRRRFLRLAVGAGVLPVVSRIVKAQSYPSRPITMVAPFAAGGATDVIGRIIAERMKQSLGQPVIIESVTGANGSIGVGRVARATPHGYTIRIGQWSTHVVNGAMLRAEIDYSGYDLVLECNEVLRYVLGIVVVCSCRRGYHGRFRRKLPPARTWFGGGN
jgi:tripartite-type tricarboxylate transporter receptor subunit TctC